LGLGCHWLRIPDGRPSGSSRSRGFRAPWCARIRHASGKVAITIPLAIHIMHHVVIIIPSDGGLEIVERKALLFLGVSFSFFNLTDHSTVHVVLYSVSMDI